MSGVMVSARRKGKVYKTGETIDVGWSRDSATEEKTGGRDEDGEVLDRDEGSWCERKGFKRPLKGKTEKKRYKRYYY